MLQRNCKALAFSLTVAVILIASSCTTSKEYTKPYPAGSVYPFPVPDSVHTDRVSPR
ncbi:hypothetical protein [Chitinophaga caeni]|uniref:hypothetical protein n=1 Tax=Chitinophaga caeni TaxID=2029983 RepID=UPI0012FD612B|nr:hypothetical protein [Chitinophaga caeni]